MDKESNESEKEAHRHKKSYAYMKLWYITQGCHYGSVVQGWTVHEWCWDNWFP